MAMELFPKDDPELSRRLHRQLMGVGSWLMFLLPTAYAVPHGWMAFGWSGLLAFGAIALGVNAVFFWMLRSGMTRTWRDPSFTAWQIFASQLLALGMLHHAIDPTTRTSLLMLFVASLFFGVFGMRQRQFLTLSATATFGYLALVLAENRGLPLGHPQLRPEWLRLLALVMMLLWLSLLGSYVAGLRARLSLRNDELAAATERLKLLVSHDELTGVFNRRHLLNILGREKERSERYGLPFSVCLIDLDHFKLVNDTHGHAAGDDVLKGFAARMLACGRKIDWVGRQPRGAAVALDVVDSDVPPPAARVPHRLGGASSAGTIDRAPTQKSLGPEGPSADGHDDGRALDIGSDNTFGRYGGEEFLLVLPHTKLAGAKRAIDRLRELVLAAPFDTVAGPLRVTFSAGMAEYRPKESVADTLARADEALYRAKEQGRNRTELEIGGG
jgi:GGDEF domain-containing protein